LDFTNLAQNLFDRMESHKPLKAKLSTLGAESACFCLADQSGNALHEFFVGTHAHGSNYPLDKQVAHDNAFRNGNTPGVYSSRNVNFPGACAGSVRGMRHIISCRLIAVQPHSVAQAKDVEDLSEIVAIIYGREIKKRLGIQEMPKDLVLGHLSRYRSPLLPLFDPFL
jgi:hypothetical protein